MIVRALQQIRPLRFNSTSTRVQRCLSSFKVIEHVVKCQHTRDRPAGAELGHENDLRLHVKQYLPYNNPSPQHGDVTLIGLHANGFAKELYEPLWEDLSSSLLASQGKRIRAIWIADIANQGQSGVFNERLLGPDPSWWDHSRDLMKLINQFQEEMPHPIVGIGHSMGGSQLAYTSLLHPRLLDAMILIDPVIQRENPSRLFAPASTYRRDIWSSRKEAGTKFACSKFYQRWDPRVLGKWIEYGLRDLPTEQYPDEPSPSSAPAVTLTTTKAQEVAMYLRPAYHDDRMLQPAGLMHKEMHPDDIDDFPMYRSEPAWLYRRLPELSPRTLYIFGKDSELSQPSATLNKLYATGTGIGGNGGLEHGGVAATVLECGHLVPMEKTKECAEACAAFIGTELSRWDAEERQRRERWERLSRQERVGINDAWRKHIGEPPKRPKTDKLK